MGGTPSPAIISGYTDGGIITATIQFVDNVDPAEPSYDDRRARYALFLQELVVDWWLLREWPNTLRTTTLGAVDSDGLVDLPEDFLEVPKGGGLFNQDNGTIMAGVDIQELMRERYSTIVTKHAIYAIGGGQDGDATRSLVVPRGWENQVFTLTYKRTPPVVADEGYGGTPSASTALDEIPPTYHYSVFLPGMRFRGFEDKGDPRAAIWMQKYIAAISKASEIDRSGPQKDTLKRLRGAGYKFMC